MSGIYLRLKALWLRAKICKVFKTLQIFPNVNFKEFSPLGNRKVLSSFGLRIHKLNLCRKYYSVCL